MKRTAVFIKIMFYKFCVEVLFPSLTSAIETMTEKMIGYPSGENKTDIEIRIWYKE